MFQVGKTYIRRSEASLPHTILYVGEFFSFATFQDKSGNTYETLIGNANFDKWKEKKTTITKYANLYKLKGGRYYMGDFHDTKKEAECFVMGDYNLISTTTITWEE